jgi:stage III sporulation protein SpoIIIAA
MGRNVVFVNTPMEQRITDNLDLLFAALPERIRATVSAQQRDATLLEVVLDLGRAPEARFLNETVTLDPAPVTREDIDFVIGRVGTFGDDNRAGIERTLHRISAIRNRRGAIVGLTCRVGRAVFGTVALIRDVVEQGRSLLILGRPGVGKTTILREVARVLADDLGKRVVIVDTSNEIAGDGDVPHPGIGHARRMQVARPAEQHAVMIEAVENHMPEVIIIDEIGTELEALAARTIAERGVQLVGTAHGNTLDNLLLNPTLSDLVGGISSVTLGDEEARRRGTQKTVLERKAPPTFDVVVEQQARNRILLHADVAAAVDALLRGEMPTRELRELQPDGALHRSTESARPAKLDELRGPLVPQGRHAEALRDRWTPTRPRSNGFANGAAPQRGSTPPRRETPPVIDEIALAPSSPAAVWYDQELAHGLPDLADEEAPSRLAPLPMPGGKRRRIYPMGINRSRLEQVIRELGVPADVARDETEADTVLVLKSVYRKQPDRVEGVQTTGKPVYVLRTGTVERLREIIADLFGARPTGGFPGD